MSDIRQWLEELGLGQYADAFEANAISRDSPDGSSQLPIIIAPWVPEAMARAGAGLS